jgi:DNA-binding transcriptional MerR regulator
METTPSSNKIPDKLFYKAAEVCQITDTQPYVLRFWESEFPQLASEKNRSGQRVYRREDIDLVFRIKRLLYQEEYTIAGARKAIDEGRETFVEPGPSKTRPRQTVPVDDTEEPFPDRAMPVPLAPPAPPPSLFGETRPESPETPVETAAASEESRYRALYEETLAALANVKGDLARTDTHLDALRERNRRLAARIETALET